jgi:hypothetical protein
MPEEVEAAAMAREQQLLESWKHYIQTMGPCVVAAYRGEQLLDPPYVYVFNRVKDEMQHIALEWLLEEEFRQDEQEGVNFHL